MTPTEIANLPVGRELDALVAERVLGCKVLWRERGDQRWPRCTCLPDPAGLLWPHASMDDMAFTSELPRYSTDWNAAGEVIKAMWAKGYGTHTTEYSEHDWRVAFLTESGELLPPDPRDRRGETFPLAVCRAAFAVVEARSK